MNTSKPQADPPAPQTKAFAHQAARASWLCPIIVVALVVFAPGGSRYVLGIAGNLFMIIGLACAVIALFGIRKHGSKGLLLPAIVGLVLNGLLVAALISGLSRAKAEEEGQTSKISPSFAHPALGALPNQTVEATVDPPSS